MINGYLMQKVIANYKQNEFSHLYDQNKSQSSREKLNKMIERYNRRVEDFLMKVKIRRLERGPLKLEIMFLQLNKLKEIKGKEEIFQNLKQKQRE